MILMLMNSLDQWGKAEIVSMAVQPLALVVEMPHGAACSIWSLIVITCIHPVLWRPLQINRKSVLELDLLDHSGVA
jgi:hypothetical protein